MLQRITLHLARTPEYPEGSATHGYEIIAPLDETGHLDAHAWHNERARCHVRRFWTGEPDRVGRLVHRAGGSGGATWVIGYDDGSTGGNEEAGYHLDTHRFMEGEYVSIRDHAGEPVPFKVMAVGRA